MWVKNPFWKGHEEKVEDVPSKKEPPKQNPTAETAVEEPTKIEEEEEKEEYPLNKPTTKS